MNEVFVYKPPSPRPWMSLGSEVEIEDEQIENARKQIKLICSRKRKFFAAPIKYENDTTKGKIQVQVLFLPIDLTD